jgi:hypothetical protein
MCRLPGPAKGTHGEQRRDNADGDRGGEASMRTGDAAGIVRRDAAIS